MTRTSLNKRRLNGEGGFTLATVMGILLISSIICAAAFQAATGDLVPSGENSDRKTAFAAAESGIQWYQSKLTANPDYWQLCDTGTTGGVADPVTQPNATNRKWRTLAGTGKDKADFSIAVLPNAPATTCSTTDPTSMLNATDGTFKVRSTGTFHGEKRSIVTKFTRSRFLNFIYFTDYETLDWSILGNDPACEAYRASRASSCTVIQFAGNDRVNGPLHTNDSLIYCGSPIFGRTATDSIEVSGPSPGYAQNSSCGVAGTPNFRGTFKFAQRQLQLPPSNSKLKTLTTDGMTGQGYLLHGTQYIRFLGNGNMVVDRPGSGAGLDPVTVPVPPNGVIYVDDTAGCTNTTTTYNGNPLTRNPQHTDYQEGPGCANVYVSGQTNRSVTIGAERDIIVAPTLATTSTNGAQQFNPATAGDSGTPASNDADLTAGGTLDTTTEQITGGAQIGLIANGFVRVYHRVSDYQSGASLRSGVRDVRIDAAILSLGHSFIVDNWGYAPSPGDLTVHGAIAQKFRGPVGTGSGATISTGYSKNYWYDNRLRYRSPPYFLDPVNAAWAPGRSNELTPPV